jgi:hypothetical protein
VQDFFESINEAAELGKLSMKDKVRMARLKMRGPARIFYSTQPRLKAEGIDFAEFQTTFIERFRSKQTDQLNYVRLQNSPQEKDESPEAYLGRLRKLCQRTIPQADGPEERTTDIEQGSGAEASSGLYWWATKSPRETY